MYKIYKFCLLVVLVSMGMNAFGQNNGILVLTNVKTDRIQLRWAPNNYFLWQKGNTVGYKVERFTLSENGVFDENARSKPVLLTKTPLLPLPKDNWGSDMLADDKLAVLHGLLYPDASSAAKSTGGTADIYNKMQLNENRFAFSLFTCDQSIKASKAHGLFIEDADVRKGVKYAYRISYWQEEDTASYKKGVVVTSLDEAMPLHKVVQLSADFQDTSVLLSWNRFYDKGIYTAYFIERSTDGQAFYPLNKEPFVQLGAQGTKAESPIIYFQDALKSFDSTYHYRIRGVNAFGEYGPFSEVVKGKAIRTLGGQILIDTIIQSLTDVQVKWFLDGIKESDLKEFYLLRSEKSEGPYLRINQTPTPVSVKEAKDLKPKRANYYRVEGIGQQGQRLVSLPRLMVLVDSIPPSPPIDLKGSMSEKGVVVVSWKPNKEEDLMGYRVFMALSPEHDPVEVTSTYIDINAFTDTMETKTLDKALYFTVIAYDINYNGSKKSLPLKVKIPDKIPPVQANFTLVRQKNDKIHLEWVNSPSDDVKMVYLKRIELATKKLMVLDSFEIADSVHVYTDSLFEIGKTYSYLILTKDESKNESVVTSGELNTEIGVRRAVTTFKGKANPEEKNITLTWKAEWKEKPQQFLIYRALNTAPPILVKSVEGNLSEWKDANIAIGNEYTYLIKAELDGDLETYFSKPIKIKY